MLRLHQTFGAHAGRSLELDQDVVRFGRLPDNEVAFDPHADLDASGRHAEVRREGSQWVLVDVGSRNGTLIQGQRITRHVLVSGDEIEFGLGGPRVRVEFGPAPSKETAAATPIAPGLQTGPSTPLAPSAPGILPAVSPEMHPTPPPSPFRPDSGVPVAPSYLPVTPSQPGLPLATPSQPGYQQALLTPPPAPYASHTPHPTPLMGQHPPPVQPPGPKKYGQQTVGMMIQAALQQAEQTRAGGRGGTAHMRAVATEAAKSSSRGLRVGLGLVVFLSLLTLGAVVALFFYGRYEDRRLRDDNVDLQRELAELGEDESEQRTQLEHRIQQLNDQLGEQEAATGAEIAERYDAALWALVRTSRSRRSVICSAFSVRADLLATSAHCVNAVERALGRGDMVRAIANHGSGAPLVISQMYRHPQYSASAPASPDIGLMRIRGTALAQCDLASMTELSALRAGDDVFVLGFPSALASTGAPVAGVRAGVIGRLTAFDGTSAPPVRQHLISHSAFSDDGTAGSPIFDREGHVVAVNAGNMRARRRVTDTGTHVTRTVESDAPYAWAVRADLLLQLLAGLPN